MLLLCDNLSAFSDVEACRKEFPSDNLLGAVFEFVVVDDDDFAILTASTSLAIAAMLDGVVVALLLAELNNILLPTLAL